jgi:tetrahydromethanopterin S-methyltransferase subunit C
MISIGLWIFAVEGPSLAWGLWTWWAIIWICLGCRWFLVWRKVRRTAFSRRPSGTGLRIVVFCVGILTLLGIVQTIAALALRVISATLWVLPATGFVVTTIIALFLYIIDRQCIAFREMWRAAITSNGNERGRA